MTLTRPDLLALAPLGALLAGLAVLLQWWRLRRLQRLLGGVASGRLLPRNALGLPVGRLACVAVAAVALGLAAAEPRRTPAEPPPPAAPLDLAIAVDVSLSMAAADATPTRILRAQEVVARLADALPAARLVLVVFADWPYTLVPPTDDPGVVRYFAGALQADLVVERDQGTSLAAAIEHARAALAARPRDGARRVVLLVSDGGGHDGSAGVLESARAAAREGVEVWTAGLGSSRGTELETATGPVLDAGGAPVLVRLDERLLAEIAAAGGGTYEDVGSERGLGSLVAGLQRTDTGPLELGREPADAAAWLAWLALAAILLEGALDGRRGLRSAARTGESW
ncbi:MAG: VWA domain-containing protein [Gemmatimonadales bacterium]